MMCIYNYYDTHFSYQNCPIFLVFFQLKYYHLLGVAILLKSVRIRVIDRTIRLSFSYRSGSYIWGRILALLNSGSS